MRDLLVFCPVLRLEPETVTGMFALEWDGPISILLQRDNPTGNPYLDHLHQYQRGREAFLNGRYEGMLVVENDVIVPGDTLRRLVGLVQDGADVAYGVYVFRPRQKEQETGLPRFARNDTAEGRLPRFARNDKQLVVNVLEKYYAGTGRVARNIGESLTVRGLWESAKKKGIVECSGSGLGCVLIKREVLEAVEFIEPVGGGFCDMDWTERVYRMGFRMMADCNLICGHIDVDGEVLIPG